MWGFLTRARTQSECFVCAVKIIAVIEMVCGICTALALVYWLCGYLEASEEVRKGIHMDFCLRLSSLLPSWDSICQICERVVVIPWLFTWILPWFIPYIKISHILYQGVVESRPGLRVMWIKYAKGILLALFAAFTILVAWMGMGVMSGPTLFCWIVLIGYRWITYLVVKAHVYECEYNERIMETEDGLILPRTYVGFLILLLKLRVQIALIPVLQHLVIPVMRLMIRIMEVIKGRRLLIDQA